MFRQVFLANFAAPLAPLAVKSFTFTLNSSYRPSTQRKAARAQRFYAGHFWRWGRIEENRVMAATMTLDNSCMVATSR
jgi:hypothetical protein